MSAGPLQRRSLCGSVVSSFYFPVHAPADGGTSPENPSADYLPLVDGTGRRAGSFVAAPYDAGAAGARYGAGAARAAAPYDAGAAAAPYGAGAAAAPYGAGAAAAPYGARAGRGSVCKRLQWLGSLSIWIP